jgi:hypothetical protein
MKGIKITTGLDDITTELPTLNIFLENVPYI